MKCLFVVISIKKIVIVLYAKKQMHYSVRIFLMKEVFVVNFCKNSSAAGVCRTSLLGRRGGEKVKGRMGVFYDHFFTNMLRKQE
jgi:hypothetical protein